MNKGTAIVGFLLCFMAGMALMYGVDRGKGGGGISASGDVAVWSDDAAAVPVSSKDPTWGSRAAPVTIVEFSEYQ